MMLLASRSLSKSKYVSREQESQQELQQEEKSLQEKTVGFRAINLLFFTDTNSSQIVWTFGLGCDPVVAPWSGSLSCQNDLDNHRWQLLQGKLKTQQLTPHLCVILFLPFVDRASPFLILILLLLFLNNSLYYGFRAFRTGRPFAPVKIKSETDSLTKEKTPKHHPGLNHRCSSILLEEIFIFKCSHVAMILQNRKKYILK